ncbi:splicing factor 3A subunit 1 [Hirschfeldia incana]|nr:splicing factor 3A subunit 1 [Hirschfeldia incana]
MKILPLEAPPTDGNLGPLPPSQLTDQEAEEKELQNSSIQAPESVATHTRTIGIIHPPPDIRSIVEKTAQFVSKNGLEFEKRIIASNAKNAKFNFLTSSDPYHAFYQHKLAEYRAQNQDGGQGDDDTDGPDLQLDGGGGDGEGGDAAQADLQAQFRVPPKPLEPPEPEKYTVRLPEGITGEELEYIKLTAQFVARNGKSFLTGLQSRESNNPQFHFMKPTHSLFSFFTALVDAYFDVLKPPGDLKEKLRKSAADLTTVLERCLHRLEWDRSQEQQRKKEEDEKEQERVQMAMIDWHDFVVVESIDFADEEDDELPPPMTLEEVIRRSKVSAAMEEDEVVEPGKEVEMEMDEEEVRLVAEGMRAANLEANGGSVKIETLNDEEAPMRIVKNWKRPEDRIPTERDPTKVVISPITGELIPISEMSEHMRISLIDPKFKEQKDRMFAKIRETTLAQDDEIAKNIVGLARLRPDIFGTTEEEVSNAVKAEIEKKKDEQPTQVIWDGHTGSIGRTANQALAQGANGEEQYGDPNSFPGPAALPPPRPGVPVVRPLPPPPNLALNLPRPPPSVQYPGPPRPLGVPMMQPMHPQHQMPGPPGHQQMMMNRPPPMQHGMPVPPPPGSQFAHLQVPRPYGQLPPPMHGMMQPPPMHGMPPPPPHEEAPPLPEEPEPKRQKFDESALIPEEQFLAQHPGSATIRVSVPNVDDGQVIEITVQSLSENVGSLKEKIAGETQIPANKQKLSGKAGFLKDNMSLAHYNVGAGEILTLSLRERGGRKR